MAMAMMMMMNDDDGDASDTDDDVDYDDDNGNDVIFLGHRRVLVPSKLENVYSLRRSRPTSPARRHVTARACDARRGRGRPRQARHMTRTGKKSAQQRTASAASGSAITP
jgi:hypothetical protein